MRIVIAGAGELGFHLAKLLAIEEQDITLIDGDYSVLDQAKNQFDVGTVVGSATSINVLIEANIYRGVEMQFALRQKLRISLKIIYRIPSNIGYICLF